MSCRSLSGEKWDLLHIDTAEIISEFTGPWVLAYGHEISISKKKVVKN